MTRKELFASVGYNFDYSTVAVVREQGSNTWDIYVKDCQPTGRKEIRLFSGLNAVEAVEISRELRGQCEEKQFAI